MALGDETKRVCTRGWEHYMELIEIDASSRIIHPINLWGSEIEENARASEIPGTGPDRSVCSESVRPYEAKLNWISWYNARVIKS